MGEIGIKKKLLLLILLSNSASGNIFLTQILKKLRKESVPNPNEKTEQSFETSIDLSTSTPEKSECPLLNDQQDSNSAPNDHLRGFLTRPHFQASFSDEGENLNSTTDFKCFWKCCRFSNPNVQKKCFKRHGCGNLTNENFCYKRRYCFEKCCKEDSSDSLVNDCLSTEGCPAYMRENCKKYLSCWKKTIPKKCYTKEGFVLFRQLKRKCGSFINYPGCKTKDICEFTKGCFDKCCKDGFDGEQKTECLVNNKCPPMLRKACGMPRQFNECKDTFAPICCGRSPDEYESCLKNAGCRKFLIYLPRSEICEDWERCSKDKVKFCCVQRQSQYNSCLDSFNCGQFKEIMKSNEYCEHTRWCVEECCFFNNLIRIQICLNQTQCGLNLQHCEWSKNPLTIP